ncbi:hypothetical protein RFI_28823, partial [Reticulomyxa filosa]
MFKRSKTVFVNFSRKCLAVQRFVQKFLKDYPRWKALKPAIHDRALDHKKAKLGKAKKALGGMQKIILVLIGFLVCIVIFQYVLMIPSSFSSPPPPPPPPPSPSPSPSPEFLDGQSNQLKKATDIKVVKGVPVLDKTKLDQNKGKSTNRNADNWEPKNVFGKPLMKEREEYIKERLSMDLKWSKLKPSFANKSELFDQRHLIKCAEGDYNETEYTQQRQTLQAWMDLHYGQSICDNSRLLKEARQKNKFTLLSTLCTRLYQQTLQLVFQTQCGTWDLYHD